MPLPISLLTLRPSKTTRDREFGKHVLVCRHRLRSAITAELTQSGIADDEQHDARRRRWPVEQEAQEELDRVGERGRVAEGECERWERRWQSGQAAASAGREEGV